MKLIWIVLGAILGILWERYSTSHSWNKHRTTLFPSLIFRRHGKSLHLHHWLFYFVGGLVLSIWAILAGKFMTPAVLLVISFIVAAIVYNFKKYPDWYKFWY
jgi:hypothetical protein